MNNSVDVRRVRWTRLLVSIFILAMLSLSLAPARVLAQPAPTAPGASPESQTILSIYQRVSPSVVNISFITQGVDLLGNRVLEETSGSGFVFDQQGHILTNEHVISGAQQIDVTLSDGSTYTGDVVATDPAVDLAVLALEGTGAAGLTVAALGDSSTLQVGQPVLAIGNPFGFQRSVSRGIVSSLGRAVPGEQNRFITNVIQTDAAINPGNSGGPLLDMNGQVIGINEQIASTSDSGAGVGFAIPSNTVKRYLPDLLAGRQPQHAWLGVDGVALTPSRARAFGISAQQGVVLAVVSPNGPAATAGLRAAVGNDPSTGDIITALDGVALKNEDQIASYVDSHQPGDVATVQFSRGGQSQTITLPLGTWQPQSTTAY